MNAKDPGAKGTALGDAGGGAGEFTVVGEAGVMKGGGAVVVVGSGAAVVVGSGAVVVVGGGAVVVVCGGAVVVGGGPLPACAMIGAIGGTVGTTVVIPEGLIVSFGYETQEMSIGLPATWIVKFVFESSCTVMTPLVAVKGPNALGAEGT